MQYNTIHYNTTHYNTTKCTKDENKIKADLTFPWWLPRANIFSGIDTPMRMYQLWQYVIEYSCNISTALYQKDNIKNDNKMK